MGVLFNYAESLHRYYSGDFKESKPTASSEVRVVDGAGKESDKSGTEPVIIITYKLLARELTRLYNHILTDAGGPGNLASSRRAYEDLDTVRDARDYVLISKSCDDSVARLRGCMERVVNILVASSVSYGFDIDPSLKRLLGI